MAKVRRRKRYFNFRLALFIFLLVAIIFGLLFFMRTDFFNIDKIQVIGNSMSDTEEIIARSGITENSNIFSFNVSKSEKEIENMAFVRDASVVRRYPNKVEIIIEERAAYFLFQKGSDFYEVDFDGVVLSEGIA